MYNEHVCLQIHLKPHMNGWALRMCSIKSTLFLAMYLLTNYAHTYAVAVEIMK